VTFDLLGEDVTTSDAFTRHLRMFTHPKGAHQILADWLAEAREQLAAGRQSARF